MIRFYLALVLLCVASCKPQSVSPEALSAFVLEEENGCIQSATIGEAVVSVVYRPTDLLIHQELGSDPADSAKI